jgi:transposase
VRQDKSGRNGAAGAGASGGADVSADPEVGSARRRRFSAEYKRGILEQADGCTEPGQLGALLRREGLYSSHLTKWRQARRDGEVAGLRGHKRGPKGRHKLVREVERLQRDNVRLQQELHKAQTIIAVQKKLSEMLGIEMKPAATDA